LKVLFEEPEGLPEEAQNLTKRELKARPLP